MKVDRSRGFTLIELLIVVVVIATLMGLVFRLAGVFRILFDAEFLLPFQFLDKLAFFCAERHVKIPFLFPAFSFRGRTWKGVPSDESFMQSRTKSSCFLFLRPV